MSVRAVTHVFIHGFLGSARMWDDAPIAPERRVTPELFGHGALPPASPRTDFATERQRLLQLSPAGSHLVAYSMGARVALTMLLEAPSYFASATLVGINPGLRDEAKRQERLQLESDWCAHIREQGLETFVSEWERLPLFESQEQLDEMALERQRAIRTSHFADGIIGAVQGLGLGVMPNLWPRLREIDIPLTLVCGALDETFLSIGQQVCSIVSHARLEIIDECGHNPVLEQPERFWASIESVNR